MRLAWLVLVLASSVSRAATIAQYHSHDFTFKAPVQGNPFDVELSGDFSGPDGAHLTVPGFYDGDSTWKIRFSPVSVGEWSLRTTSSLEALHDRAETGIVCVPNSDSNVHGVLRVDAAYPYRFKYEDGIRYFQLLVAPVDRTGPIIAVTPAPSSKPDTAAYFPPPESRGGWRMLSDPEDIRRLSGMDPAKLEDLRQWLLASDDRPFGAVVIRSGYIVLEVERDSSSVTNSRNVMSCAKAICATVLAIASEESQKGRLPRRMSFDDPAFDFIPWAQPLSDPRKAQIKVKQLLNHTSGITPEGYGIANRQKWEYILGHGGDGRTASLFFDPGTTLEYSTHGLCHAALVCENVTGKPYDQYAIEALLKPLGIERWWFEILEGDEKHGNHASHTAGFPAREMARIAYCMLRNGRWGNRQVIPQWFVEQTAYPTHSVTGVTKKSFGRDARSWSHGWELLALEGGTKGEGIPPDARYKPGSGGQLISFIPSLDLVLTRQTGKSGEWKFEEYVRRAAAAVLTESKR